jgi:hypothetical protein
LSNVYQSCLTGKVASALDKLGFVIGHNDSRVFVSLVSLRLVTSNQVTLLWCVEFTECEFKGNPMDGSMRLVDASKRALALPNQSVVSAGTGASTTTSKEVDSSFVEVCFDAMMAPEEVDASKTEAKPLLDSLVPLSAVDVVVQNESINAMPVKESKPDPTTVSEHHLSNLDNPVGVRKPRVHPPEKEESIKPDVANVGAVILTAPVEI